MAIFTDPRRLTAHPDGGSGRLRDLLNRRTVPGLLVAIGLFVALPSRLLHPWDSLGVVCLLGIGGATLERERRVSRARLTAAVLARRPANRIELGDIGPLPQDAAEHAQRQTARNVALGTLVLGALVVGAWVSFFAHGDRLALGVAAVLSLALPPVLLRPVLDVRATWRRRAGLGPDSPRRLVTVVGFLGGIGVVLADGAVPAERIAALLRDGAGAGTLTSDDGAPVGVFRTASGASLAADLVPGDTLVCHGRLAAGEVVALSSATRTYWPGVLRAVGTAAG